MPKKSINVRNKLVEKYKKNFRELYFQLMSDREKLLPIILEMKECSKLIDEMLGLMNEEIDLYPMFKDLNKKRLTVRKWINDSLPIHKRFGERLYKTSETVTKLLGLLDGFVYPLGEKKYFLKEEAEARRFQRLLNSDTRFSNRNDVSKLVKYWEDYNIQPQLKMCLADMKILASKMTQEFTTVLLDLTRS
ncbi:unnamed protein product [Orchesella dallaii]|uniref:Uncharacterized protein n=1 Tax=Orchesella dallaii TaxID=48710 RepID=A0ABP1RWP2_9HEXA